MSCLSVHINDFDIENISMGKEFKYKVKDKEITFNMIYYKYDKSISRMFTFYTDYIDIDHIYRSRDMIVISDASLVRLYNELKKLANLDNVNVNLVNNKDNITLRFDPFSKLTLHPTVKSGLEKYELNKIEYIDEIIRYYPNINKTKYKIQGKFILIARLVNNKIRFNIKSGELKYPTTFIKSDLDIKPIYNDKINISL